MTRFWLTPIKSYSPLVLGADRMECKPLADLEVLRAQAQEKHPRLLPMYKASLLLSDDEDVCGSDLIELDLSDSEDVVFNGDPYHLSHCAEAFLDRLLGRQEVWDLVNAIEEEDSSDKLAPQAQWRQLWLQWLESGCDVILLREDGV
ncbi:hypothetical protein GCM10008018_01800 [Paenibacillus marchantiophytorum]|uniref:Uncharacterized protein n=1 Tax=Paenibacillus marchantiophytorum TaxID=1619310 RepID=A0ABQ2BMU1_9BACL|nr:hypothetical protein [Paenibacillus marchantiophytorum]GGI43384.1 hypothetical protein GCM10008018_01800 [Paenibacillus marchantiophytorum]